MIRPTRNIANNIEIFLWHTDSNCSV